MVWENFLKSLAGNVTESDFEPGKIDILRKSQAKLKL